MTNIRHNLNKRNIARFINQANYKTKPIISKIIQNTLYITINKFFRIFLRNLKAFLKNYKKKLFISLSIIEKDLRKSQITGFMNM